MKKLLCAFILCSIATNAFALSFQEGHLGINHMLSKGEWMGMSLDLPQSKPGKDRTCLIKNLSWGSWESYKPAVVHYQLGFIKSFDYASAKLEEIVSIQKDYKIVVKGALRGFPQATAGFGALRGSVDILCR